MKGKNESSESAMQASGITKATDEPNVSMM